MNSVAVFIFGGVCGVLLHKIVSDIVAKKKKKEIFSTINTVLDSLIDSLKDDDDSESDETEENDGIIDLEKAIEEFKQSSTSEKE